jgi:DNA invertase Pin-like site-specific DNA recombinase
MASRGFFNVPTATFRVLFVFVVLSHARRRIVHCSKQLDTSTPAGKMAFTVLAAVAELERSSIVERVKAGLRKAKAKGKRSRARSR